MTLVPSASVIKPPLIVSKLSDRTKSSRDTIEEGSIFFSRFSVTSVTPMSSGSTVIESSQVTEPHSILNLTVPALLGLYDQVSSLWSTVSVLRSVPLI